MDHRTQLLALINANWTTQVVRAACELDIPGHLGQNDRSLEQLASATGCHAPSLLRLAGLPGSFLYRVNSRRRRSNFNTPSFKFSFALRLSMGRLGARICFARNRTSASMACNRSRSKC